MLKKDFVWDEHNIARESSKTSELFVKYIQLWDDEKTILKKLKSNIAKLIIQKRNYYSGNGTPEEYKEKPFNIKIRSDAGVQKYIDADEDVLGAKDQIEIQEQKVEILLACLDEIKRRGYALKTALEEHKFKAGG